MDYSELPKAEAIFNQAQFQMIRIHRIMEQVNLCWVNLTEKTENLPNHQILFDCLVAYYMEVRPNFTPDEQKTIDGQLKAVEEFITGNSLWEETKKPGLSGYTTTKTINMANYYTIRQGLRDFQSKLFEFSAGHGLLNPPKADPRRAVVQN